jgi:hypothetical protein
MTQWTADNYLQDAARSVAQMKTAMEQNLGATVEMLGALPIQSLTISGASVTPLAETSAFLSLATPGGAASANLTNVVPTNIKPGAWIALRAANAGQTVVVKHASGGAGQFSLVGNADLSLADPTMILLLALSGTTWIEVGRFYGAQLSAAHAFYQTAGLGQNRFTGRQEFNRGAALTAAATLALGTDGNYFQVVGTTPILGISAAPAGTRVTLNFSSAGCLLVHGAGLVLAYGNHLTRAGDVLEFVSEGSGTWREIAPVGTPRVLDINAGDVTVANSRDVPTQIYAKTIEGNVLGTSRRIRCTLNGVWSFGAVQQFGSTTIYGTTFRIAYGATVMATVYIPGGVWDNSRTFPYTYTPWLTTQYVPLRLVIELQANGAANAQTCHVSGGAPMSSMNPAPGTGGATSVVTLYGVVLGSIFSDINGVFAPGFGSAAEDSTLAKTFSVTAEHNYGHPSNAYIMEHAMLEVLP